MGKSKKDRYARAHDLLFYEGEMLWKIMSTFMVTNTIYIGFIANTIDKDFKICSEFHLGYCLIGIVGLLITFAWLGTFKRNSNYYHFRMEQAKEVEPDNYKLLVGKGAEFAAGHEVSVNGQRFQNKCLANFMRNKRAGYILIWTFIFIYTALILVSIPLV